jgi:predicted ATP-grasp superfamily ATP-dependent carboligase
MRGASKSIAAQTNAVVVGGGPGGLGIIRSLAPQGVACYLAVSTGFEPAAWSRFCRPVVLQTMYGEALIEGLLRLRRSLDHNPVLLCADEVAALTISAYRKEIESSSFIFRLTISWFPYSTSPTFIVLPRSDAGGRRRL